VIDAPGDIPVGILVTGEDKNDGPPEENRQPTGEEMFQWRGVL